MKQETIRKIFNENKICKVNSIRRINIGFTNKVYSINNRYILKVCQYKNNEEDFEREVTFYKFFSGKIPVPKIVLYDKSKKIYNKDFMVYIKLHGDNLYSKWHLMTWPQRKNIIKQLCKILKNINKTDYKKHAKDFKLNARLNWHDKIYDKIFSHLRKVSSKKIIPKDFIDDIKKYVEANHQVLKEQNIALVYWDAHFDNILIRNNEIVGILDFERTELASIDFTLDIIRRMVNYPKKYITKDFEKYARKKDYSRLLVWFKEFYPELFKFKNLEKRLNLYSIKHDLDTLLDYPKSKEVKKMIAKTVNLTIK